LEGDKGKRVAKTNIWGVIKRKGKYLQGFEDNFKEGIKEKCFVKQQGLQNTIDCKLSQA